MENLPDQETIRAIREGKTEAFQQVFDACYEGLCQYAFTILKDADEAEDTVQAMFIKLWEKRENLIIKYTLRAYLFRSVYNQCMNQLAHKAIKRKYQAYSQQNLIEEVQQPEIFPNELEDKVKQAINGLPPQCRTIFLMSRYEELRYAEIAQKLNISVNTIQNQICKALRILRAELKDIFI